MSRRVTSDVRRPRAAHLGPTARRPLVLDAALTVWDEDGYGGTTMAAIAAAAGVSKPVLYECFPTKDATLLALLDREEQRLLDAARRALPDALDADDQTTWVAAAYRSIFRSALDHPISWRVFLDAGRTVPRSLADRVREGRESVGRDIAALLIALADSQDRPISGREARVRAMNLIALAEQNALLLLHQEAGPDAWEPDELARVVAEIVVRGWT